MIKVVNFDFFIWVSGSTVVALQSPWSLAALCRKELGVNKYIRLECWLEKKTRITTCLVINSFNIMWQARAFCRKRWLSIWNARVERVTEHEWHAHALLQHFHCIKPAAPDWLRAREIKLRVEKISDREAESHQLQTHTHTHSILPASHTQLSTMREIVHIQAGQCGNQIGAKVRYSLCAHISKFFLDCNFTFYCKKMECKEKCSFCCTHEHREGDCV